MTTNTYIYIYICWFWLNNLQSWVPRPCYSQLLADKYKVSPLWCRAVCVLFTCSGKVIAKEGPVTQHGGASDTVAHVWREQSSCSVVSLACHSGIRHDVVLGVYQSLNPQNMVASSKDPAVSPVGQRSRVSQRLLLNTFLCQLKHGWHGMFVRACLRP